MYKIEPSGSFKGYFGVSSGKGHQVAKNHLEKVDRNRSCRDNLEVVAMSIVSAHEEFKEKTYEFEASMISDETNNEHKYLDWEEREKLRTEAEENLEE